MQNETMRMDCCWPTVRCKKWVGLKTFTFGMLPAKNRVNRAQTDFPSSYFLLQHCHTCSLLWLYQPQIPCYPGFVCISFLPPYSCLYGYLFRFLFICFFFFYRKTFRIQKGFIVFCMKLCTVLFILLFLLLLPLFAPLLQLLHSPFFSLLPFLVTECDSVVTASQRA